MARYQKKSVAEVEAMMIPKLRDAIYPVLIPVETQDLKSQERNHQRMTALATQLWHSYREQQ